MREDGVRQVPRPSGAEQGAASVDGWTAWKLKLCACGAPLGFLNLLFHAVSQTGAGGFETLLLTALELLLCLSAVCRGDVLAQTELTDGERK
ncbi:uncharacterized protein V6R79_024771 [Siganus canaliculatus]